MVRVGTAIGRRLVVYLALRYPQTTRILDDIDDICMFYFVIGDRSDQQLERLDLIIPILDVRSESMCMWAITQSGTKRCPTLTHPGRRAQMQGYRNPCTVLDFANHLSI